MGQILFEGEGPYSLPVAQSVRADATGGTVEATIRLLAEPHRLELVRVQMLPAQALEVASQLMEAAEKAAQWERSQNKPRT